MLILFFIISVLFSSKLPSLQQNFTYFSYTAPYQALYILWLIALGILIYVKILKFSKGLEYKTRSLCHLAFVLYLIGGCLPYTPNTQDFSSTFHIVFSTLSILLVFYILYRYVESIRYRYSDIYQKVTTNIQVGILSLIPLFMINGSINIIVELYCLGFTFYTLYLLDVK